MARAAPVRERARRLRERLADLGVAAFLVTSRTNVRYLTGFDSSNAWLLLGEDRTVLLTDGRYIEAARAVEGVETIRAAGELARELARRLPELTAGPVAFEATSVTVAVHATLAESGVELTPTSGEVERLRAVKDEAELQAVRASARLLVEARNEADTVMTHVRRALRQGGHLVGDEERAAIAAALAALERARATADRDLIRDRTTALNRATERLAELMMDAALKAALQSQRAAEILAGGVEPGSAPPPREVQ